MKERLQKVMAHAGVGSRRACEQMIIDGLVSVNGKIVTQLGIKVDPNKDVIKVNNRVIQGKEPLVYYLLHKPKGFITSVSDERGRKTVMELLPEVKQRIYPVGRLDYDSEGLLLLTNDGRLANRLIHPRYQIRKYYLVKVEGQLSSATLEQLRTGVELEDGLTSPAIVQIISSDGKESLLKIGIHEGRKRQIRRMCAAVGHPVKRLIRVQMGPIKLGKLEPGKYRQLTEQEVGKLRQAVKVRGK